MKDWIIKFVVLVLLLSFSSLPLAAEVIYYDTNNVGTPVAMWNSTGGKVWEATYYPFGTEYQTPTNIWENTRKFAGKEKDKETDLSYFGARYYDDLSGRFLTPDPVQPVDALTSKTNAEMLDNPQRLNRYAYGLNNPYRYVDPDGKSPLLVFALIGAASTYLGAPDIANGPTSADSPTQQSNGVEHIALGAVGGVGVEAASATISAYKLAQSASERECIPNSAQQTNINRFLKKIPANAKENIQTHELPNDGIAVQATSPGKVPGSRAVYEKQIDIGGKTNQYTKTTYDPQGNIVHVKDKISGAIH